ncbi:MAG: biotin--[acetyl-CoA-carboxylase] ligase [Myxococcales bacterium]|nr:biotin--[acetyl-CoA-carboxylase] ligase [Myxococcales bacterium]
MRFRVERHEALSSTNDRALELARQGQELVAVIADRQTRGRGQRGKAWSSPDKAGLYVSFLIRPALEARRSPLLTLLAGVAVHDAVASQLSAVRVGLKWPNDLLVADGPLARRKVAGILVESATRDETVEYVVIGVGLNVARAEHSSDDGRAVSLEELGARELSIDAHYPALEQALVARLEDVQSEGTEWIAAAFNRRALGLGRQVSVRLGDSLIRGTFLGAAADGGLRIQGHQAEQLIHSGELDPADLTEPLPLLVDSRASLCYPSRSRDPGP